MNSSSTFPTHLHTVHLVVRKIRLPRRTRLRSSVLFRTTLPYTTLPHLEIHRASNVDLGTCRNRGVGRTFEDSPGTEEHQDILGPCVPTNVSPPETTTEPKVPESVETLDPKNQRLLHLTLRPDKLPGTPTGWGGTVGEGRSHSRVDDQGRVDVRSGEEAGPTLTTTEPIVVVTVPPTFLSPRTLPTGVQPQPKVPR